MAEKPHDIYQDETEYLREELLESRLAGAVCELQRRELEHVLDSIPALVFFKDTENRFLLVSQALADATGLSKDNIEGKTALKIFPEQAEAYLQDDLEVINSGIPKRDIIEPFKTVSGSRWVKTDKIPYRDETGSIVGIIGFSTDITDLMKAQDAAEDARLFTRNIIDSSLDIIVAVDKDRNVIEFNSAAEKAFGYTREEMVNGSVGVLYDNPEEGMVINTALQSTGRYVGEISNRRKNGEVFPSLLSSSILRDGKDNIIGYMGISHDITAEKEAEERIRQIMEELSRSNKELEQFAYVASHDLQEPLRMISSYTELLKMEYGDKLDDEARRYIGYATEGAARMRELIDDLLIYARVGTRGNPFVMIDCGDVCQQVLRNLEIAIEETGAQVICGSLPELKADKIQLVQLFQNLIGNALKFKGKESLQVRVSAERHDGEWVFAVRDNGIGIDPGQSERIFLMFQRLHARSRYEGTGIGLAVSKKIVQRHRGKIWVESELGKGSAFFFALPVTSEIPEQTTQVK